MASSYLQSLVVRHLQIQKHTARAVDFKFFVFILKSASVPFFFLADRLLFFLLLGRSALPRVSLYFGRRCWGRCWRWRWPSTLLVAAGFHLLLLRFECQIRQHCWRKKDCCWPVEPRATPGGREKTGAWLVSGDFSGGWEIWRLWVCGRVCLLTRRGSELSGGRFQGEGAAAGKRLRGWLRLAEGEKKNGEGEG